MRPKTREVYRDPIYGIPHFHDPAISRITMKHDPSYQVSKSMKMIYVKSSQRLRAVRANKPKYLHTRFNIDTLLTSPLMIFPHFQDMTDYLSQWFTNRDARQAKAITSKQKERFNAQDRFANSLFLLLQESARSSPVSSKPLRGIYNWYLQRDSVINSSKTMERKAGIDEFFIIELNNGQEIRVPRHLMDVERMCADIDSLFTDENLTKTLREVPVEEAVPPAIIARRTPRKKVEIITGRTQKPVPRRATSTLDKRPSKFDYDKFHEEMERRRQDERDVDAMAAIMYDRRRDEISRREGWS